MLALCCPTERICSDARGQWANGPRPKVSIYRHWSCLHRIPAQVVLYVTTSHADIETASSLFGEQHPVYSADIPLQFAS